MTRRFFYFILTGVVSGIILASVLDSNYYSALLPFVIGLAVFISLYLSKSQKSWLLVGVALFLIGLSFGQVRFIWSMDGNDQTPITLGKEVEISGQIIEPPERRENYLRVIVESAEDKGRILVKAPLHEELEYGDHVTLSGVMKKPANFMTDTGREFDYVSYLAAKDIVYEMTVYKKVVVDKNSSFSPFKSLFRLKESFVGQLNKILPEPESSLAAGILLGVKESLGTDLEKDFRRAGIIHIIVLSGYNITIIADSVARVMSFLPWRIAIGGSIFSVIAFAIMVGGGATVIRASIMALIAVLARATGRIYDAATALFVAGLLMIIHNPSILLFDLSFQLSFLATLGLIYLAPVISPYVAWLPNRFSFREIVITTVSAQLFVLPWILYKIGEFSIVALVVNLLVIPLVPLSMLVSFLAGVVSFVSPILASPFSFVAYGLLAYVFLIVKFFTSFTLAALNVPPLPFLFILGIYLLYGWVIMKNSFSPKSKLFGDKNIV